MSDRSSESSCEWYLLNDDDLIEEILDDHSNLELNLNSVSLVASEPLRSSLSSEELEWQYDLPVELNNLSPYELTYVEDVNLNTGENKVVENGDKVNDISVSDCDSSDCLRNDIDLNLASIKKVHCYTHKRNENLNHILNLMLAVAVSSAIGLGTGYFLGWSHKCWTSNKITNEVSYADFDALAKKQTVESVIPVANGIWNGPELSKKSKRQMVFEAVDRHFPQGDNIKGLSTIPLNDNKLKDVSIPSPSRNADILGVHVENTTLKSSDNSFLHSVPKFDSNDIHEITIPIKNTNSKLQNPNEKHVVNHMEKHSKIQDKLLNLESDFFERLDSHENNLPKINFTIQFENDLIQIIQTLNVVAISQFTSIEENSPSDLEQVNKFFTDFQGTVASKLVFIENFVREEYKKNPNYGIQYLRKMVYALIDSLDAVVKKSLKMFSKYDKRINAHKFLKNLSKVIFNFDKKWLKYRNTWSLNLEKAKHWEQQKQNIFKYSERKLTKTYSEKSHRNRKEEKYWKAPDFPENHLKQKWKKHNKNS